MLCHAQVLAGGGLVQERLEPPGVTHIVLLPPGESLLATVVRGRGGGRC